MGVHRDFPRSPYAELVPEHRWFPAAEEYWVLLVDQPSFEKHTPRDFGLAKAFREFQQ